MILFSETQLFTWNYVSNYVLRKTFTHKSGHGH